MEFKNTLGKGIRIRNINDLQFLSGMMIRCGHLAMGNWLNDHGSFVGSSAKFRIAYNELHCGRGSEPTLPIRQISFKSLEKLPPWPGD